MKIRKLLLCVGLAAMAQCAAVQAADIHSHLIRFGYGLNQDSNQGRAVNMFAQQVKKLSGGKMQVRAIGAAALGSDIQMQQALIGGAQEMMVGSTATLVGVTKEMAIWDTPFLFNSGKEADQVLDGKTGEQIKDKLKSKGLVGLVYWENGFRNLTNSSHPVNTVADFDGLKLRVMQNNVFLKTFKLLGSNAVPLPFSELFTALETKTVDGQENPFNTILSSKFYEVQKYVSITNHVYSPWIVLASEKWWNTLTPDEQSVLMQAARASRTYERQDTRKEAGAALDELKKKGMIVNVVSPQNVQKMRERIAPVNKQIEQETGTQIWQAVQDQLAQIRKD